LVAIGEQFASRIGMALETRRRRRKGVKSNFLTAGATTVTRGGFTKRTFFELCLKENDRRMKGYDPRLLRPMMMPRLMKLALKLMKPA
jgi:hypothetical protein